MSLRSVVAVSECQPRVLFVEHAAHAVYRVRHSYIRPSVLAERRDVLYIEIALKRVESSATDTARVFVITA